MRRITRIAPAVLPARFPSVVESDSAVVKILREWSAELRAALRQVRKREQMTLRLFGRVEDTAPPVSPPEGDAAQNAGTRYLTSRAGAQAAPELEPLRRMLGPILSAERITRHEGGPLLLTAYYLVPRGAAAAYRRIVRRHAAALGWRSVTTGPWPPYAFVPELG